MLCLSCECGGSFSTSCLRNEDRLDVVDVRLLADNEGHVIELSDCPSQEGEAAALPLFRGDLEVLEELVHAGLVLRSFTEVEAVIDVQEQDASQDVVDHEDEDSG